MDKVNRILDMKLFFILLGLILTVMVSPSYAFVKTYNINIYCPTDSFDFSDVYVEYDRISICPTTGNVLDMDYNNPSDLILVGNVVQYDNEPAPLIINQLEKGKEQVKQNLLEKIQNLVTSNLKLSINIDETKAKLLSMINKLKQNLMLLDKNGYTDIINSRELDKIIQSIVSARFVLPAFGENNSYVVKNDMNEIMMLLDDYNQKLYENEILQKQYANLLKNGELLQKNLADSDVLVQKLKSVLSSGIDNALKFFKLR